MSMVIPLSLVYATWGTVRPCLRSFRTGNFDKISETNMSLSLRRTVHVGTQLGDDGDVLPRLERDVQQRERVVEEEEEEGGGGWVV